MYNHALEDRINVDSLTVEQNGDKLFISTKPIFTSVYGSTINDRADIDGDASNMVSSKWDKLNYVDQMMHAIRNYDCSGFATKVISKEEVNGGLKVKAEVVKKKFVPVLYTPKKIIYNGPATIVFWEDGTKTIVKRAKKEKDNKYNAFCAALAKKLYGNNSTVNRLVKSGIEEK